MEMSREEFLKVNFKGGNKEHEVAEKLTIVDYIKKFEHPIAKLVDIIIYNAPETEWSNKHKKYVETGNVIKKACLIVKPLINIEDDGLGHSEDRWSKENHLVYAPLSKVDSLEKLKNEYWTEDYLISFGSFTTETGKEIGYIIDIH